MSDEGGWWKRVREELISPWDWVAAGLGATGGLILSTTVLHADMGASVGAGALGAVTAKKAIAAASQRRVLEARTRNFLKAVEGSGSGPNSVETGRLLASVRRDLALLNGGVITPDQYRVILDNYVEEFRQITLPLLPSPNPSP